MARDVSIAISAKDNFTQAITTMRNANQSFNKDLSGLQQKMDQLNRTKTVLKVDTDKAKAALKEAEKQFAVTGEAADKLKLELANANYENARRNLSLVSDNAKQAEKDIRNLTNAVSKSENRAQSAKNASSGILGTIAASGATSLVGNVAGELVGTLADSAFGAETGSIISSALSTGTMGATIGTAIAPGIGTAIGALGGAILGYVQGESKIFEERDDAFKSYYKDLYEDTLNTQKEALASGTGIASTRETNRISFSTLLGGDEKADKFLESLTDFAASTPFAYDELTNISKVLLAYGYKQDEILPLLEKVGDTGSALGMSSEDMKYVATSLGRMQTTGKTTMEYLNPLLERGIDVWSYLAEASGKTKKEVQEMVSKGLVPGEKAAQAIADYMGYNFKGNMEKQAQTYSGLVSTLEDANNELNNAMGKGYTETRKGGLSEQIDYLSGESGEKMQEAYSQIGQWKASLENLQEKYLRDAMDAVMSGTVSTEFSAETQERLKTMYEDYTKYASDPSEEAGAKMGELLAEAQAIAQNEYNASEGAQLALQSNKTLADNIRDDTASKNAYWDAGYGMGQEFTKGLAAAMQSSVSNRGPVMPYDGAAITINPKTEESTTPKIEPYKGKIIVNGVAYDSSSHAYGLNYVPYNNYPALLHEGERVLTASENRSKGTTPISVTITGNSFVVRSEDDIQKIGAEIARQMKQAIELVP